MRASTGATSILFAIMIGLGFCQTDQLRPEVVAAEDFFVRLAASLGPVLINGRVLPLSRPTIQESIGLTAQEAKVLTAISTDYESKRRSYYEAYLPLRREARFQSIESGQVQETLARRIQDVQNEHSQMALAQMFKVKTALGDSRFHALEVFLHSDNFSPTKR
jgi:hypothetical protein